MKASEARELSVAKYLELEQSEAVVQEKIKELEEIRPAIEYSKNHGRQDYWFRGRLCPENRIALVNEGYEVSEQFTLCSGTHITTIRW